MSATKYHAVLYSQHGVGKSVEIGPVQDYYDGPLYDGWSTRIIATGDYDTVDGAARDYLTRGYGGWRWADTSDGMQYIYLPGRYEEMTAEVTHEYLYVMMEDAITADTTDEGLEQLLDEAEDTANSDHQATLHPRAFEMLQDYRDSVEYLDDDAE